MHRFRQIAIITAASLSLVLPATAHAQDYFSAHIGWFDVIDDENPSTEFGGEYRFDPIGFGFRPTLGLSVNTDGGVYGYGGFNWDIAMVDNKLYFIPNFMVGAYGQGDSKDLGHGLEFRSGLEVAYQMPNQHRIGVAINHTSNASLGDKNPGTETLLMNYSIPVGKLF